MPPQTCYLPLCPCPHLALVLVLVRVVSPSTANPRMIRTQPYRSEFDEAEAASTEEDTTSSAPGIVTPSHEPSLASLARVASERIHGGGAIDGFESRDTGGGGIGGPPVHPFQANGKPPMSTLQPNRPGPVLSSLEQSQPRAGTYHHVQDMAWGSVKHAQGVIVTPPAAPPSQEAMLDNPTTSALQHAESPAVPVVEPTKAHVVSNVQGLCGVAQLAPAADIPGAVGLPSRMGPSLAHGSAHPAVVTPYLGRHVVNGEFDWTGPAITCSDGARRSEGHGTPTDLDNAPGSQRFLG